MGEELGNPLLWDVHGRGEDMHGFPVKKLHDEFPEVGLVYLVALPLQDFVDAQLLGGYGFPFDDELFGTNEFPDDLLALVDSLRHVDLNSHPLGRSCERIDHLVEMGKNLFLFFHEYFSLLLHVGEPLQSLIPIFPE